MLANDIVLDNADGSDVTYRLTSQGSDGSRRVDIASTLALPGVLQVRHSSSGKVPNIVDRHLVSLTRTVATSTGSVQVVCNFTITIPRDVAVTSTIIHNVISNVIDFLDDGALTGFASTANVDAILRGES